MRSASSEARPLPVWWLVVLATPTSLSANTTTTAIPSIARDLGLNVADATWLATAFGWGSVVGIPLVTAVIQRRGTRGAVEASALLVGVGTVGAVLSPWFSLLLAARVLQAVGGGAFITIAVMSADTPARTGTVSASIGLVGAAGPLAGAVLAEYSWRLPLCTSALALLIVPPMLRQMRDQDSAREALDVRGVVLVLAVVTGAVLLSRSPLVASGCIVVATVFLVVNVRRRPTGFIPAAVVRDRTVVIAAVVCCGLSTTYFALLYLVPRTMEASWSRTTTGTMLLASLGIGSLISLLLTRSSRVPASVKHGIALGSAVLAVAARCFVPWPGDVVIPPTLAVLATTAGFAAQISRVAGSVPTEHQRSTTSLITLAYTIGGALGPAIASQLLA